MHEVSLMQNMLEIVQKAAEAEGGGGVKKIHLRIGAMSGVNADSLRFAFDVISKGTAAEGGILEIEEVPLKLKCRACSKLALPEEFRARCPFCSSTDVELLGGREMEIDYILMDDEAEGSGRADSER